VDDKERRQALVIGGGNKCHPTAMSNNIEYRRTSSTNVPCFVPASGQGKESIDIENVLRFSEKTLSGGRKKWNKMANHTPLAEGRVVDDKSSPLASVACSSNPILSSAIRVPAPTILSSGMPFLRTRHTPADVVKMNLCPLWSSPATPSTQNNNRDETDWVSMSSLNTKSEDLGSEIRWVRKVRHLFIWLWIYQCSEIEMNYKSKEL